MGWLRWLTLAGASALLSSALLALHMPAAVLLGCMVCALAFSVRGLRLAVPRRFFGWGQGLLGCLMAQSLHPTQLGQVMAHWPAVLGTTVLLIAASSTLGWWLMRHQVMPGTTAVWGMAPGAASAMVVLAEEYGADVRLVAFMQYTRVVVVTVVAALVARAAGAHAFSGNAAVHWLETGSPAGLALTATLVVGGFWVWYEGQNLSPTWWLSPKIFMAVAMLVFYAFTFHARAAGRLRGPKLAHIVCYGTGTLIGIYLVLALLDVLNYNFYGDAG